MASPRADRQTKRAIRLLLDAVATLLDDDPIKAERLAEEAFAALVLLNRLGATAAPDDLPSVGGLDVRWDDTAWRDD